MSGVQKRNPPIVARPRANSARIGQDRGVTEIQPWLREILRCPACQGTLRDGQSPAGTAELVCNPCNVAYRIDDGIPVMLVDEARGPVHS